MLVPISLIIDDSCPLVHVYAAHRRDVHHAPLVTPDGREIPLWIPNEFLVRYCDVVERHGIAGKFSIVPAPGGVGDVVRGIEGHDPSLTREWLEIARERLSPRWDFSSEGITHNLALNLQTGEYFPESENAWSQRQNRETLRSYLVHQLALLRDAGIDAGGVTSPWVFGEAVEADYAAAIGDAQRIVYGRGFTWYFLHQELGEGVRPRVMVQDAESTVIHVPCTTKDAFWDTIESPRTNREWIDSLADRWLTRDGRAGQIRDALDRGSWPILVTHWQSLFSCGLETGLAALDEVGKRVSDTLAGEVRWHSFRELLAPEYRHEFRVGR